MTASVRASVLAVAALACGCGPRGPIEDDLAIRIVVPEAAVAFGRPFELTVERVWNRDLDPDPWRDDLLAPLVVEPLHVARREATGRVSETRRFRAYAFDRREVVVPPIALRAAAIDGGPLRSVTSDGIRVRVQPDLDARQPGAAELPSSIQARPPRWPYWVAACALGAAGVWWFGRGRRFARPAPGAASEAISAHARARARLARLRASMPSDDAAIQAWHVAITDAARAFVADATGLRTATMTSEEIRAAAEARLPPGAREALAAVLGPADLVKFARRPSSPADGARILDAADALVERTPEQAPS